MGNLFFQVSDRERLHVFKLSLVPWLGRGEVEGLGISEPKAALNSLHGNREREATGNSAGRCHQRVSGGVQVVNQLPCLSPRRKSHPQGALILMSDSATNRHAIPPSVCLSVHGVTDIPSNPQ